MAQKKQTYREAFAELEKILEELEGDNPDVDDLATRVRRASELIKFCKGKLHDTESEIEKIIDEMDSDN
jgi:exodeoxyribonuclease VII small subunit